MRGVDDSTMHVKYLVTQQDGRLCDFRNSCMSGCLLAERRLSAAGLYKLDLFMAGGRH